METPTSGQRKASSESRTSSRSNIGERPLEKGLAHLDQEIFEGQEKPHLNHERVEDLPLNRPRILNLSNDSLAYLTTK